MQQDFMPQDNATGHDHIASARALQPAILAEAAATEANRQVSAALMAKIHDARLLRMLVPRTVGGDEVDLMTFVESVEEVAKADASTAWTVGQGGGCAFGSGFLATEVAREVFGVPNAVLASGPNAPGAKAVAVDGGYIVSGNWRFASGSRNAQWIGAHCTVYEADGTPRPVPAGKVAQLTAIFPKSKAAMKDVWRVMGLNGTGSDDYSVQELFVPEAYTFTRDFAGDRREPGPLYKFSNFNMFGFAFAGIAVGLARTMMNDFRDLAGAKKTGPAMSSVGANAAVQQQFGFNEAKLRSARAYLYSTIEEAWEKVSRTGECTLDERISLRMMSAYVIQTGKDVVDFVYHAAGSNAIFDDQPFERRFRDINVVTQQGQAHLINFENAGQMLLGQGARFRG